MAFKIRRNGALGKIRTARLIKINKIREGASDFSSEMKPDLVIFSSAGDFWSAGFSHFFISR